MIEVLRIVVPMVSGVLIAAIGFYAVHQQNVTQRETLAKTTASQADQQRVERLTAWRRERYGELLAALGEYVGALRSMNLALGNIASNIQASNLDVFIREFTETSNRLRQVNLSSRVYKASVQVADAKSTEMATTIGNTLWHASRRAVAVASLPNIQNQQEFLARETDALDAIQREADRLVYELNERIERLVSDIQ